MHILIRLFCTLIITSCAESESFVRGGPTLTHPFSICSWWVEEGSKYHYKRATIGPPAKRHLNGVSLACQWWSNIECWLGSFVIFLGVRISVDKKPYILWFFRWGPVPLPPLDPHMHVNWIFPGTGSLIYEVIGEKGTWKALTNIWWHEQGVWVEIWTLYLPWKAKVQTIILRELKHILTLKAFAGDSHEKPKSKWVWSGNTTVTCSRPTHGTMRKSHRTV